ncbi:MAG: hypothetical protein ACQEQ4_01300 [Fibrobacterota bacterium]
MPIKKCLCLLCALNFLWSAEVDFSGAASLGYYVENRSITIHDSLQLYNYDMHRIGSITTDVEWKVRDNIRLRTDLSYDIDDAGVDVGTFDARFLFPRNNEIRAGYMKKRATFEERRSHKDRLLGYRSIIHGEIRSYHLLGRDLSLAHRKRSSDKRVTLWNAFAADLSYRFHGVTRIEWEPRSGREVSGSFVFTQGNHSPDSTTVFTGDAALAWEEERHYGEFELTAGTNPAAERVARQAGNERRVFHGGGRMLYAYSIITPFAYVPRIRPIIETAYQWQDISQNRRSMQFRPGVSTGIFDAAAAELIIAADIRFESAAPDHRILRHTFSGISGRLRLVW